MSFAPVRLGNTVLEAETAAADRKSCRRFGPCGVGEKALYLNDLLIDRHFYVGFGSVRRVFKRVAMSQGGFSGKGAFGSIPYLVAEQTGGKINHIPVRLTAEAVEPAVNLHAGMFVIVEGTAGHPISAYRNPINFRSLPCGDRLLHRFKYIRFSHLHTEKKAPGFRRKSGAS